MVYGFLFISQHDRASFFMFSIIVLIAVGIF